MGKSNSLFNVDAILKKKEGGHVGSKFQSSIHAQKGSAARSPWECTIMWFTFSWFKYFDLSHGV